MNEPNRTMGSDGLLFARIWFFSHSLYHRTGGPAIEMSDGRKEWYIMGEEKAWQPVNAIPPLSEYDEVKCSSDLENFPGYGHPAQKEAIP
jgi:hypothetical protein